MAGLEIEVLGLGCRAQGMGCALSAGMGIEGAERPVALTTARCSSDSRLASIRLRV